jgi:hypothetical protein
MPVVDYFMTALGHHLPELHYLLGVSAGIEFLACHCVRQAKDVESEFIVSDTHRLFSIFFAQSGVSSVTDPVQTTFGSISFFFM